MNILFVHSQNDVVNMSKPMRHRQSMPLGLSYISSVLKKNGHVTQSVVLGSCFAPDVGFRIVERAVREFGAHAIAYSSVSTEYDFIEKIAARAKRKFGKSVFQVIGGPHASLAPDTVISGPFDALCVGEGEYPILELMSCLQAGRSPQGIANLWIKNGEKIEKNATRPFIDDLDEIPFPDRGLWEQWISPRSVATYSVLLGRGCPFDCTYCSNHALKKLAAGKYVRFRSPGKIISEIDLLVSAESSIRELYLEVETIGLKRDWILDLCSDLVDFNRLRTTPLTFGTNLRVTPGCDYGEVFRAMKSAGFRFINIGLESGSERIRQSVLHRNYSNEDVIRNVEKARQQGLQVAFQNLIGLPGETLEDFAMTVEMNRRCRPDWYFTNIFYPYPGTKLYQECVNQGLIRGGGKRPIVERFEAFLDQPQFTRRAVNMACVRFDWYVNRGFLPVHKILMKVLSAKIRSMPRLKRILRILHVDR